ncbi:GNAT family N-acetyltransferase [Actinosynnema sp. NPDC059335]|uniref:GNAT family N-acetyltransferase n=1 Tax=Actinosynnema sp. NPDC059335 TaxID=3346804 RepID=UPI003670586B
MASPLDNPVWASLTGPHAHFAQRHGQVLRYPPDVSAFTALPDRPDERVWSDLAALAGPGSTVPITSPHTPPAGWEVERFHAVQLVDEGLRVAEDAEAVRLGPADVPEMLALVERTRPGPFLPRTVEMGVYLGIRRDGALVAMAGERLHPPGWTEISAVCTDEAHRGQGLATRLVRAVAAGIRARGEQPMMHATASNTTAIRLYESLGFRIRKHVDIVVLRIPADVAAADPTDTGPAAAVVRS